MKDVAQVAAHVMTGKGKHGFADKHRGQLMVVTGMFVWSFPKMPCITRGEGPMLATGDELATAASQALDISLKFEDIPP
jgi:hypothetical protein